MDPTKIELFSSDSFQLLWTGILQTACHTSVTCPPPKFHISIPKKRKKKKRERICKTV